MEKKKEIKKGEGWPRLEMGRTHALSDYSNAAAVGALVFDIDEIPEEVVVIHDVKISGIVGASTWEALLRNQHFGRSTTAAVTKGPLPRKVRASRPKANGKIHI